MSMSTDSESAKSLYARLNGYDGLAAIVDEFLQTLASESQMARFAAAMNLDSRRRNRQLTLDYLCAATGGPAFYLGKDMKTSHAGLGISASDWKVAMDHIERALKKLKVPESDGKDLLALVDGLAREIVEN
jgi:hemoglobin